MVWGVTASDNTVFMISVALWHFQLWKVTRGGQCSPMMKEALTASSTERREFESWPDSRPSSQYCSVLYENEVIDRFISQNHGELTAAKCKQSGIPNASYQLLNESSQLCELSAAK